MLLDFHEFLHFTYGLCIYFNVQSKCVRAYGTSEVSLAVLKTLSHSVAQTGLKLTWPQPPK